MPKPPDAIVTFFHLSRMNEEDMKKLSEWLIKVSSYINEKTDFADETAYSIRVKK